MDASQTAPRFPGRKEYFTVCSLPTSHTGAEQER